MARESLGSKHVGQAKAGAEASDGKKNGPASSGAKGRGNPPKETATNPSNVHPNNAGAGSGVGGGAHQSDDSYKAGC